MKLRSLLHAALAVLIIASCTKEPQSATDPLPLPPGVESGKDLSIKPGDNFYDYCNGTWLKNTPIPATSAVGGMYAQTDAMEERVKELRTKVPDIDKFYSLKEAASGQPEASKAFIDAQKARFPKPQTREEAFITIGKLIAEGNPAWGNNLFQVWTLVWKDGKLMGNLLPILGLSSAPDLPLPPGKIDPARLVPVVQTKAGEEGSALSLVIKGMGFDPSLFAIDSGTAAFWDKMSQMSLDDLLSVIDNCWEYFDQFSEEELKESARNTAAFANAYTFSYYFAKTFLSQEFKDKYLGITREIQGALRKRIQNVDWMSETTKSNAIDKLDHCTLNVAFPDQWYMDAVAKYTDCATLAEAVYRGNRGIALMKSHLLGSKDMFSSMLTNAIPSTNSFIPADLTLMNAMYDPAYNAVFIYPALMLPPTLPENVTAAYEYAMFVIIGHELTHGFDTNGSKYDKYGNQDNWWTVADRMAFEERRDLLVSCYNHLEIDPVRKPGIFSKGDLTQTEDIADLGGFLAALDAYKARLEAEGYKGETMKEQLRKFYESYANVWRVQYSDEKLAQFPEKDVHSHARLRANGVVMNTDLWYELFEVDRNCRLFLPKERRAYIW